MLISLGVIVALLVAAALVGPSFVDWNSHKGLITEQARSLTGRDLEIDGDVRLSVIPAPTLSASKVRLANIEGGSSPSMVELEALNVRVAVLPLLRGRVQVVSVSLVRPKILLEVLPDGRRNWDFRIDADGAGQSGQGAPQTSETPSGGAAPTGEDDFTVQVDSFAIQDGLLIYQNQQTGREERLEALNAQIVAESLKGPFAAQGDASARGIDTEFKVAVGRILETGATPVNLDLTLPNANANGNFSGSLSLDPQLVKLRGRLKSRGENFASLVATVSGKPIESIPAALANGYVLKAVVAGDHKELSLTEVELSLGDTSLSAQATAILDDPIEATVKISVPRLGLDQLLAQGHAPQADETGQNGSDGGGAKQAERSDVGAGASDGTDRPDSDAPIAGFTIPRNIVGDLQVAVDALVYRGQVIRQIRLNASMGEGAVAINQALALLPGGSDISITGLLVDDQGGPKFNGHVEAAADSFRGILGWLGMDVTAVPADRLRKMSLSTKVDASPTQISLSELDLRLDVSRVVGGAVIALRKRLALGIGLSLDTINLDAYLPAGAAPAADGERSEGAAGADPPTDPASAQSAGEPRAGGLLDSFDANLKLRARSLKYRGQMAKELNIDGTLQNGVLTLRQASLGDFGGASLTYTGAVTGLESDPALDGSIDLRIADPARLAKFAGIDDPALEQIGPVNITSNVRGTAQAFGFNSKLAALGGRFGVSGTISPLEAEPRFDLEIEAQHPDLDRLVAALARAAKVPKGLGSLDLRVKAVGSPRRITVSDANGQVGPLGFSGRLDLDLNGARPKASNLDIKIRLDYPDVVALAQSLDALDPSASAIGGVELEGHVTGDGESLLVSDLRGTLGPIGLAGTLAADVGGESPALRDVNVNFHLRYRNFAKLVGALGGPILDPSLGAIDLKGQAIGDASALQIRDMAGTLGATKVTGSVSADLAGAKPSIAVDLATGELNLTTLLADAKSAAGSGGAGNTAGGRLSQRWSHEPIDLGAAQSFDGNITLRSDALVMDKVRLAEADVGATLRDGVLEIQRLQGSLYNGRLSIAGVADLNGAVDARMTIKAQQVQLQPLLSGLADFERVSGPLSVDADLTAKGTSEAGLISSLAGQGNLGGNVIIVAKAEEQLGAALLGVLGEKVKEIRGLTETTNSIFGAFAGTPSDLTGTFSVENGVLRTDDTRLENPSAYALTQGTADLGAWRLESRSDVFRGGDGGEPYLTATLSGPLDSPNVKISGVPLQRQPQGTSGGTSAPQPSAPQEGESEPTAPEEDLRKVDPKELLQDFLKGLSQ